MRIFALAVTLVFFAVPASASDGVLEINQTCATQSGCFPGDVAGFPVTITQQGSYRLTGNLDLTASQTGIQISASDVTIDLGGFEIRGPNTCSTAFGQSSPVCTTPGSGRAITDSFPVMNTSVRNGAIRGMTGDGLSLNFNPHVEDVSVTYSGGTGMDLGTNAHAARCSVRLNAGRGMLIGESGVVVDSVIVGNGVGMEIARGTIVRGSRIDANSERAIFSLNPTLAASVEISDNTIRQNGSASTPTIPAIDVQVGRIARNVVTDNFGDGIKANDAVVVENHVSGNGGCAARFATNAGRSAALADNEFVGNNIFGSCPGTSGQTQISGFFLATTCSVVTCTSGSAKVGTFCPPSTLTCLP